MHRTGYCTTIGSLLILILGCGGAEQKPTTAASTTPTPTPEAKEEKPAGPSCQQPIAGPQHVWPRVEEARALSDENLMTQCGLPFIEEISGWRTPPVDLIAKIVHSAKEAGTLEPWLKEKLSSSPDLVEHAVAIDIIAEWQIGQDPAPINGNIEKWQTFLNGHPLLDKLTNATALVVTMLPKVTEIHKLRCQLEVNPLGFAVDCEPIHPAREKIDLNWKAEMRDGHLEDLALTHCKGSKSCKQLEEGASKLKTDYLALMQEVEQLEVPIYKEQMKEWLVLVPFK